MHTIRRSQSIRLKPENNDQPISAQAEKVLLCCVRIDAREHGKRFPEASGMVELWKHGYMLRYGDVFVLTDKGRAYANKIEKVRVEKRKQNGHNIRTEIIAGVSALIALLSLLWSIFSSVNVAELEKRIEALERLHNLK